jgi:hypothetical protein
VACCCAAAAQWLEIKPGDDEKTVARKKKLLKSYKSKKRFQQMDIKQKERADSWQSFLKGKGSKPKQGEGGQGVGSTTEREGGGMHHNTGAVWFVLTSSTQLAVNHSGQGQQIQAGSEKGGGGQLGKGPMQRGSSSVQWQLGRWT